MAASDTSASPSEPVFDPEAVSEESGLQAVRAAEKPKFHFETEFVRLAASRGMRICAALLACVVIALVARAHTDSLKELGRELLNVTAPPVGPKRS